MKVLYMWLSDFFLVVAQTGIFFNIHTEESNTIWKTAENKRKFKEMGKDTARKPAEENSRKAIRYLS